MRVEARSIWLVIAAVVACDAQPAKPAFGVAKCELTLWYKPQSPLSRVEVVTGWEGWQAGLHVLDEAPDGWRATRLTPPPGELEYAFVDDGVWVADPFVSTTAFHDGAEVTLLFQQDCSMPSLRIAGTNALTFVAASDASPLDPTSIKIDSDAVGSATANDQGDISIAWGNIAPGKHVATVTAADVRGRVTAPARITLWSDAWDWRDALVYQVIVDRYRSANGAALASPSSPSGWAGGTLAGLTVDLDAIAARGFNALWVSPLYQNPQGTFGGNDGRDYTGYHGYWPTASRAIDARFGTEQDVFDFVSAAHVRGMRVIFDVVPHHVHEDHPYVTTHPGAPWFTDWQQNCVCGVGSCDWQDHIQDCWFAGYLPSFDWHEIDVADTVTADIAWWIDHFDGDGLRIDAVPMMPRAASRRIVDAVRRRFDHPGQRTYVVGENFVGPGAFDLLRYELGPYGLDGEFDFPMMWTLREAIAQETAPMSSIDAAERAGEQAWAGSGAVMSRMIGNHDVARFSTVSAGDAAGDGFLPAPQSSDPTVYAKQRMALAVTYTLPGAAVVYYGDEVGLAGRNDPDSRRVMPSDASLLPGQVATRDFAAVLGKLRACSSALRRGSYRSLVADAEATAYAREDPPHGAALVVVARNPTAPITLPLQGMTKGTWVDALGSGLSFDTSSPNVVLPSHSVAIYVPQGDVCAR